MFQFPGCPPHSLWIQLWVSGHYPGRVSPFGYPRIDTCLQFPVAFRSLPRPSSAVGARASTLCSYSLDFFVALLLRPTYNFFHLSSAALSRCLRLTFGMVSLSVPLSLPFELAIIRCNWPTLNLFLCAVVKVHCRPRLGFLELALLRRQWVAVDSNYRPLAYQASALTD